VTIRQPRETRWEWQDGGRWHAVEAFQRTRRLIWSSWVERPDGPAFDDGFAQTFEQFLGGELPPVSVPSAVIEPLRAALTPEPRRRSVFGWFRRG
jgi:hypothetical protein